MAKRTSSLLAAAALCAAGAAAFAADTPAPLGQTLTGETCHAEGSTIVCGKEAAGTLRVSTLPTALPTDSAGHRTALLAGVKALPEGLATARDVTCDPAQWIGGGGQDAALYLCALRASNWPRVILVAGSGKIGRA